jgi:VWFA-related protein
MSQMQRQVLVTVVAMAMAAATMPSAQQPPQPTFRAEINYVELPVRVLDAKGAFVRDLKQSDFQVFEDGAAQQVASFGLVDLPAPVPTKVASTPKTTAPVAGMSVDRLQKLEGRISLFIVDDYHLRPQYSPRAKQLVQTFIRDRMGENDVAAIVFTSGVRSQDFTQDRALLLSTLDRLHGTFDSDEPGSAVEMKARSVVKTITDFAKALGAVKGKHKALIFVSPAVGCGVSRQAVPDMPVPLQTYAASNGDSQRDNDASSEGNGRAASTDPAVLCQDVIWDGVRAAVRADVSVYSLDPRGAQNPGWVSPAVDGRGGPSSAMQRMQSVEGAGLNVFDGMHVLADETGGFAVTGTNSFSKAFDRIVAENSSYYVIGYYSSNDKADGSVRRNTITVGRSGVQVLYRAAYVAPRN